jgi:hypothetical protein
VAAVASSGLTVVTFSKFSEKLEAAFSAVQNSNLAAPLASSDSFVRVLFLDGEKGK